MPMIEEMKIRILHTVKSFAERCDLFTTITYIKIPVRYLTISYKH